MVLGQLDFHAQRNGVEPSLTPQVKINTKWVEDLNTRAKTVDLPEENMEVNFHDLGLHHSFLVNETSSNLKPFLCFKEHGQENAETAHRKGENLRDQDLGSVKNSYTPRPTEPI